MQTDNFQIVFHVY